ncbi:MAG: deoxyribodipyrimidine photo-lyase [Acidobacteria bacterium]|nr:deoxyribodipyrimidine photo-lyase [Acidobacteriota bacterium]
MGTAAIVWFRDDLRILDNPALEAAAQSGGPVVPVYIDSFNRSNPWAPGSAVRWWLHQSLSSLSRSLESLGSRLVLRSGPAPAVLRELIRETGARTVCWSCRYGALELAEDAKVRSALIAAGVRTESFNANLLFAPWSIRSSSGEPFRVFTPFWRACRSDPAQPHPPGGLPGKALPSPARWPESLALEELALEPAVDWAGGLRQTWKPGEEGANRQLSGFLQNGLENYPGARDMPAVSGTSRLSPHLRFGEISPRQIWHAVLGAIDTATSARVREAGEAFLRQLGWREFAYHLLFNFPETVDQPLRPDFLRFPWRDSARDLKAWQRGRTGFPFVDAGMRELWATGWMHNRLRMVTASFLTKDLMLPWLSGARWFWDTLVDADLANNTLGWQWTAGCGADAAPYFRVFNPVSQGQKFDPEGHYIRRWVPELAALPVPWIFRPWEAPAALLTRAGVRLGHTYPRPIVDHAKARERALAAYYGLRQPNGIL